MKNLIKKIAPIVLAGIVAASPIYSQSNKTIDLRNGYAAESQLVINNLDLLTSALAGEVILQKIDKGYAGKKQADTWQVMGGMNFMIIYVNLQM